MLLEVLLEVPLEVVYTVVPVSAEDCEGEEFTITVTVKPAPVVASQTVLNISSRNPVSVSFNASTSISAATYNITNLFLNLYLVVLSLSNLQRFFFFSNFLLS